MSSRFSIATILTRIQPYIETSSQLRQQAASDLALRREMGDGIPGCDSGNPQPGLCKSYSALYRDYLET